MQCVDAQAGDDLTRGSLSLLCTQQRFTLSVTERRDVTLETVGSRDLTLSLFSGDQRIAFNDDGGHGVNARLTVTLEPGSYTLVAQPFESAVGAYLVRRRDAIPTARTLQAGQMCTDNCASARDGECDDGGPNSLYAVCDFGSDCADCGVRNMTDLQGMLNAEGQLCANTCGSAHDNECDDGGPNSLYDICALGTDCGDCGPRAPPMSPIPR